MIFDNKPGRPTKPGFYWEPEDKRVYLHTGDDEGTIIAFFKGDIWTIYYPPTNVVPLTLEDVIKDPSLLFTPKREPGQATYEGFLTSANIPIMNRWKDMDESSRPAWVAAEKAAIQAYENGELD